MDSSLLLAAAAAVLLLLLALRLREPRRGPDLMGPPKRGRIAAGDAARLRALVADGREEAALRLVRELGYDEADARKLVRFAASLEESGDGRIDDGPPGR